MMACIGAGLLLGALALRHLRNAEQPLIALAALRIPTYAMTLRGGSLFRVSVTMAPFLPPTMFQLGFGLIRFASGLLILPLFAGSLGMKIVTTRLLRRYGFRRVLLVNGTLTTLTIVGCAALTPSTPYTVIAIVLFASGLTRPLQFGALNSLAFADVPPEQMGAANTLANVVQQLTLGFGIAAEPAVHLAALLHRELPISPTLRDFRTAIVAAAIMAAVSTLDALALSPDAGSLVSGHRPLGSEQKTTSPTQKPEPRWVRHRLVRAGRSQSNFLAREPIVPSFITPSRGVENERRYYLSYPTTTWQTLVGGRWRTKNTASRQRRFRDQQLERYLRARQRSSSTT